ncbi:nectin-2-like [Monodelphis domestica]|uniref:nectin-2-like n=1 Tax=Monodelphis domestica TaxID=13616 RepID=UPI0024E270EF|nr:nectin-2-like [Monodelphis domestica]XP_007491622.2 nectin-2-like [Monodelphis domestica]XP_007491623.2 nectin-2-like [Monodelphis domestica]
MDLASSLPFSLLLLLLPLSPCLGATPQSIHVKMPAVVHGLLGKDVQLPCHLVPKGVEVQVSQVTWLRQNQTSGTMSIAVYHPTHGVGFPSTGPGVERLAFVSQSQDPGSEFHNATLLIRDLRGEDEANYTCEFATFPGGNGKGTTLLRVLAEPKSHAESYEVASGPDPVTMASCVSSGGRPPARISWSFPLAGQSHETRTAEPGSDTFTVTSHLTQVPMARANGEKAICKVEHETLREPALLSVTLAVRYCPEVSISSHDDDWYVGRTEASLNCDAQSNPEPTSYNWSTISGSLPSTAVSQGAMLIFHPVDWSVNTTFICQVTNALGTGWANRTIHVKETSSAKESSAASLSTGQVVAIVVGVISVLSILGVFLWKRKSLCPGHQDRSATQEISYTSVACTTSSPQTNPIENGR